MTSTILRPSPSHRFSISALLKPLIHSCFSRIKIENREQAIQICKLVPAQCPFARDVDVFGKTLFRIPPLCKINPAYDDLMALRFQALSFLVDQCGEDVSQFC